MSEDEFTRQVMAFATLHGFRAAHFRPARTAKGWRTPMSGNKGWPDCVFAKAGRVIVAELKVAGRKPTEDQLAWLAALSGGGVETYTWYPASWQEIERVLGEDV